MPVVAIVNQKGGTGKTTLSINLSSAFAELYPTLLLDADPQGSALDWADSRSTTRSDEPRRAWSRAVTAYCGTFGDFRPTTAGLSSTVRLA